MVKRISTSYNIQALITTGICALISLIVVVVLVFLGDSGAIVEYARGKLYIFLSGTFALFVIIFWGLFSAWSKALHFIQKLGLVAKESISNPTLPTEREIIPKIVQPHKKELDTTQTMRISMTSSYKILVTIIVTITTLALLAHVVVVAFAGPSELGMIVVENASKIYRYGFGLFLGLLVGKAL